MLNVIIVWHSIGQADCTAWEEGFPTLHDEEFLGHYHLKEACTKCEDSMLHTITRHAWLAVYKLQQPGTTFSNNLRYVMRLLDREACSLQ